VPQPATISAEAIVAPIAKFLIVITASKFAQRLDNERVLFRVPAFEIRKFRAFPWQRSRLVCRNNIMTKPFSKKEAETFFARLRARDPEPKTELNYINPYTLLVAVVLSAQATDKGVNKATASLFKIVDTPDKMVKLGEAGLTQYIKTIGLYRNKAKNVIALSKSLIDNHGGNVPRDREALEALPGVGRKTANVVLNVAFHEPTIAVDTHIFRVSNRTGLAPGKNPYDVEMALEKIVPAEFKLHAHHWLILHGRYTCVARKPLCPTCAVSDLCRFPDKTKEPPLRKPAVAKHAKR
jgi:endonuclease-3